MSEYLDDTKASYDIFVEEDRVTFVRRPEQAVDSTPAQAERPIVLIVMLGAHGLIALLSLLLAAYLTLVPATATVYALASGVPALAHVYTLPALTMSKSEIISTTGRVHVPATQARGLVTFYNSLTQPQVIDAGMLLIGSDGEQVVTDQVAYVPAGNLVTYGNASVWAHALSYGEEGNIRAGDIYGPCCRAFIQAVNAAFTGGHGARGIQTVTRADISTATTDLAAQLQQSMQGRVASLLPPGDAMLTPVPCSTHTTSSEPVGAQASQVSVTVRQTCTPAAYNVSELQHALASLIAGKSPGEARTILLRQDIQSAAIRLAWLRDRLPADASQIHVALIYH
jgi:hypothetical protein